MPFYGGCVWPADVACFTDEWDTYGSDVQDRSLALASATLERLTGYRVGACPVTVRPCRAQCVDTARYQRYATGYGYGGTAFSPWLNTWGQWVNVCGCASTDCGCVPVCEVVLPAPVGRVDEVKVDGTVVDPSTYRIDGDRLVWTGTGDCPWPLCQDLSLADTEPDTFSVTYLNAYPVDSLGAYAAGVLAMEYGRACVGGSCRLPAGVTQIVRQGITMEIAAGSFPAGATGIREVDAFIALWNPTGLTRQASVYSPSQRRPRYTTL